MKTAIAAEDECVALHCAEHTDLWFANWELDIRSGLIVTDGD